MKLNQLTLIILFQLILHRSTCEASIERTNDDYIKPLLGSLDFDIDDMVYEANWLAGHVEAMPINNDIKNLLNQFLTSTGQLYEPLTEEERYDYTGSDEFEVEENVDFVDDNGNIHIGDDVHVDDDFDLDATMSISRSREFQGLQNQRINNDISQSYLKFEGSYKVLSDILISMKNTKDFHDFLMIFAVYKHLYGINKCKLTVSGRTFKVEPQYEKATIFPKLKVILIELAKHFRILLEKMEISLGRIRDGQSADQDVDSCIEDFEELIKYSGPKTLTSDFELFEAARDMSFRDPNRLIAPSINKSRRLSHLSRDPNAIKTFISDACKTIRARLKKSIGLYVLLIGIDACSMDKVENISPVHAKLNEYYRLCNELAVAERNSRS